MARSWVLSPISASTTKIKMLKSVHELSVIITKNSLLLIIVPFSCVSPHFSISTAIKTTEDRASVNANSGNVRGSVLNIGSKSAHISVVHLQDKSQYDCAK